MPPNTENIKEKRKEKNEPRILIFSLIKVLEGKNRKNEEEILFQEKRPKMFQKLKKNINSKIKGPSNCQARLKNKHKNKHT